MKNIILFFVGVGLFAAGFFIGYPGADVYKKLEYYERNYGHHTTDLDQIDHSTHQHKKDEACPVDSSKCCR